MESEKSYHDIRKDVFDNAIGTIRLFADKYSEGQVDEALSDLEEMDEARELEIKSRAKAALYWESLYQNSLAVTKEVSALAKSALEGNIKPDERKRLDEICSRF